MDSTKRWYQSKAIWAGVVAVLVAAYNMASQQFGIPEIPEFVFVVLGAFGIYGRAGATTQITSGK